MAKRGRKYHRANTRRLLKRWKEALAASGPDGIDMDALRRGRGRLACDRPVDVQTGVAELRRVFDLRPVKPPAKREPVLAAPPAGKVARKRRRRVSKPRRKQVKRADDKPVARCEVMDYCPRLDNRLGQCRGRCKLSEYRSLVPFGVEWPGLSHHSTEITNERNDTVV